MNGLLDSPIPTADDDTIVRLARDNFGISGTIVRMQGERDLNVRIDSVDGPFAVKIANAGESPEALDMQAMALEHLARVDPSLPVPRPVPLVGAGRGYVTGTDIDGVRHAIRAVTFVEGHLAEDDDPVTSALARSIGVTLARLQRALRGFGHRASTRHILWDARLAHELRAWIRYVDGAVDRALVAGVFDRFDPAGTLAPLPAQVIHNDFHTANLVVSAPGSADVTGIIDFGDMVHGARAQDVATAVAYSLFENLDVLATAVDVIGAFCEQSPLEREEIEAIPELVAVRLAQSITIGARRADVHPDNADYILSDAQRGRDALRAWLGEDEAIVEALLDAAGHPARPVRTSALIAGRDATLHPGLRLSYDEPIHAVFATGVWIEAADGTRYLDAYNNVPQVGHGNRRVTAAVANQMAMLNTNTRYLTDRVVDCAARLTGLLPPTLDTCLFVNSGSEANDLALRVARAVTGNRGVVISHNAYHGWTEALMDVSPEERGERRLPSHVITMRPPDDSSPGEADDAVKSLAGAGIAPAALLVDTIFSSDGIHDPAASYLDGAATAIREAGGLYIADEIQAGLGRVGRRMWGFASGNTVPDIVTLGKPIGNGFPVGVVVTSRDLATRFADCASFFSTFGGNPVAAAAVSTVLSITLEHDLASRAETIGGELREALAATMDHAGLEGTVRGAGLFVGVDLADERSAIVVAEAMRRRRVLVGVTGGRSEVLKIRPPLIFSREDAALLVEVFSEALGDL